jgi:plasmid maintenance system antidote protein VapI
MNVSAQQINKIVKGKQNLTFETIGKLEDALGISLIEIIAFKPTMEIKTSATQIQFVSKNGKNKKISKVLQKQ